MDKITRWFTGRIPADWFEAAPEVEVDPDEILVVGELAEPPEPETGSSDREREALIRDHAQRFREATRQRRVELSAEAEVEFRHKISWGVRCGSVEVLFSPLEAPARTRLGIRERKVVDQLIASGVARDRSSALAWCVRMVGEAGRHESEWPLPSEQTDTFVSDAPDQSLTAALTLHQLRSALTGNSEGHTSRPADGG
ncbi:MAG TPA: hypothetical protein VE569_04360 [Acidimicrobiia bacterium]|nr:hypothetical protein [Acidimicrobiia bacterium]